MDKLGELREFNQALRQQVKAAQRTLRTAGQMLADFEERLAALENAQPQEAQREQHQTNGSSAQPRSKSPA